jgi:suppressor for copper-sensitivity B
MKKPLLSFVAVFLFLFSFPVFALTGEWQTTEQASARLIASDHNIDQNMEVGLHLRLQPRWHAYWRSPGDAGLPPQLDWAQSENLGSVTINYPLPTKEEMQGLITYGYGEEVVFPLTIQRLDPAKPLNLKVRANVLVCADICVPAVFNLALEVPLSAETSEEAATLLANAWAKVPRVDEGQGAFSLASATLNSADGKNYIDLALAQPHSLQDPEMMVEVGDSSTLPISSSVYADGIIRAELGEDAPIKEITGKELIFTLVDRATGDAVEKKLLLAGAAAVIEKPMVSTMPEEAITQEPAGNLGLMILFAIIGGLILNLMPCVLPVLALKSLSFVSHGGGTPSGVRLSFLATSAGILFSFAVIAVCLIGLKAFGMSVGWGVQFQHPGFLVFLIVVLLLFAGNLWGLFEIPLPRFLADRLGWTQGHGNLLKDFFSGAFATLLATPCTAPFLGTAVGFALAAGATEIWAVFLSLGIGLALPYLLIAAVPSLATKLPKPGKWMDNVRRILSAALLITAIWLGYVLAVQLNAASNKDAAWKDFDRTKIAEYVTQGKTVFVDVTAEWCLTCKFNKKTVISQPDMMATFAQKEVILMRADWTRPDKTIEVFLKDYGRYGIPFNIVYGPAQPQGVPLPELLSREAVLEGLKKASGS